MNFDGKLEDETWNNGRKTDSEARGERQSKILELGPLESRSSQRFSSHRKIESNFFVVDTSWKVLSGSNWTFDGLQNSRLCLVIDWWKVLDFRVLERAQILNPSTDSRQICQEKGMR